MEQPHKIINPCGSFKLIQSIWIFHSDKSKAYLDYLRTCAQKCLLVQRSSILKDGWKKTNRNLERHYDASHSGFLHAKNTYIASYSSSGASHIIIRAYISKIADSTISAGVSKNSYSKARCVCNASIIFMELPSNLRNIHVFNASFDITITFPFYLKYSQTVLQDLSKERTFSKNFRLFYLSVSVRFTKTNIRSYN